jgi:DHA1 family bicyclomycin/chloramphenicol resistance-like MFS transporter
MSILFLWWYYGGPTLTQNYLLLTPSEFGWICFACGMSYTFGAFLNSKFVIPKGIGRMFNIGMWLMLIGGCSMLVLSVMFFNVAVIILPLMLYTAGMAMIMPNSYAGALIPFSKIAGFAAAVLAGSHILGGFVSSFFIALLPEENQTPLALILVLSTNRFE